MESGEILAHCCMTGNEKVDFLRSLFLIRDESQTDLNVFHAEVLTDYKICSVLHSEIFQSPIEKLKNDGI